MRTLLNICMIAVVLAIASPAMATIYTVDLGESDVLSDPLITLSHWGEAESGGQDPLGPRGDGTYGGIGNGNSRMVWGNDYSGDLNAYAYITFPEDIASVAIVHLNGRLNDSFDIHVGDGTNMVYWGSYDGFEDDEYWYTDTFSGTPGSVLRITATIDDPTWRADWGQLAIDTVEADTVPEPATIALLGIGGLLLRRKRNKA